MKTRSGVGCDGTLDGDFAVCLAKCLGADKRHLHELPPEAARLSRAGGIVLAQDAVYTPPMTEPARVRATTADFLAAVASGRVVELIDGEIVERASPRPEHGAAQAKLAEHTGPFHRQAGGPRGPGGWWIMTEVEVSYPQTGEVFRHDAVGFRRDRHPNRPTSFPIDVRPDWVAEILSTSNARTDLVKKLRTLHLHGVPHYWILDPAHETLLVFRHGPEAYLDVLNAGREDIVRAEPFDAVEIDVGEMFGHEREAAAPPTS